MVFPKIFCKVTDLPAAPVTQKGSLQSKKEGDHPTAPSLDPPPSARKATLAAGEWLFWLTKDNRILSQVTTIKPQARYWKYLGCGFSGSDLFLKQSGIVWIEIQKSYSIQGDLCTCSGHIAKAAQGPLGGGVGMRVISPSSGRRGSRGLIRLQGVSAVAMAGKLGCQWG